MAQLEPYGKEIEAAGVSLAYIAAQKRGGMFKPEEYLKEHPVSFPYLLDQDRAVTKQYGVYMPVGVDGFNIARMATFVIDAEGLVRWTYVAPSQFHAAAVDEVLGQARALKKV
jgi:peroxiredoxin